MKTPKARIALHSTERSMDYYLCPEGGQTSDLRFVWVEDSPEGPFTLEWRATGDAEFVGKYEHIKAVKAKEPCFVYVRCYDSNGFHYDCPAIQVLTYTPEVYSWDL